MELARRLHHHTHPSASGLAPRGLSLWDAMFISTMLAAAATVNARVAAALAEFRRHDAVYSCTSILHLEGQVFGGASLSSYTSRVMEHMQLNPSISAVRQMDLQLQELLHLLPLLVVMVMVVVM